MRVLILCALLSGCAAPVPQMVDTACSWVIPMMASASDTTATKREILNYETTRQANCPSK